MIVHIDTDDIRGDVTLKETLMLILISLGGSFKETQDSLIKKGLAMNASIQDIFQTANKYKVTPIGEELIKEVLKGRLVKPKPSSKRCNHLAEEVKKIYNEHHLKGNKPNSNTPWCEGVAVMSKRFETFFNKFPEALGYDDEKILNCFEKYIASFQGSNTFMRVAKYFIFKSVAGDSISSDLMTALENYDEVSTGNYNWLRVK